MNVYIQQDRDIDIFIMSTYIMLVNMHTCIQTWKFDNIGQISMLICIYLCMFSYQKRSRTKFEPHNFHQNREYSACINTHTFLIFTNTPRHIRTMGKHMVPQGRQRPRGSVASRQSCRYWCTRDSCPYVFAGSAYVLICTETHVQVE